MLPVQASYRFDQFLLHLIQEVTQKPSADVLNFFYELTQQICQISMEKRKGQGVRKVFHDYYPGTSIPFHMLIVGHTTWDRGRWNQHTRNYDGPEKKTFRCEVEIGFPAARTYMDAKKLEEMQHALMEQSLLGAAAIPLPLFEKPPIKNPKMFKKFMDEVCGRQVEEEKEKKTRKRKPKVQAAAPAPVQATTVNAVSVDDLIKQIFGGLGGPQKPV